MDIHFKILHKKKYVVLKNKYTAYKRKKKKMNIRTFIPSYFVSNSQEIAKLYLDGIFNLVILFEANLLSSNNIMWTVT